MIFGDYKLIEYKDGFSIKENKTGESERPDFVLRHSSLSMVSSSVEALTHSRIATQKGGTLHLEKGAYADFHSLFEKSFETYRTIKAEVDVEALPHAICCVLRENGHLKAGLADKIKIEIREVIESDQQDIYCGNFFFHEVTTQNDDGDLHISRVLEFHCPLTSASFSTIFDAIKAGDNFLGLSVSLPAYIDVADSAAGSGTTIHLLDPSDAAANFTVLTGVFSRKSQAANTGVTHVENREVAGIKNEAEHADSLAEIYSVINDTNHSLNESKGFLKTISLCMVVLVPCVAVAVLKLLL